MIKNYNCINKKNNNKKNYKKKTNNRKNYKNKTNNRKNYKKKNNNSINKYTKNSKKKKKKLMNLNIQRVIVIMKIQNKKNIRFIEIKIFIIK